MPILLLSNKIIGFCTICLTFNDMSSIVTVILAILLESWYSKPAKTNSHAILHILKFNFYIDQYYENQTSPGLVQD